ncbi:hypothetical protein DAEQUDRAFT_739089 [Daedalea quercina L-15889]|uniref:DUF6533 domain-containing protein n=1 Tax=Daedalea quercina L-15889 TaxID=1314783 RepID=A0A165P6N4_9APHY|nr:hypothetical protein DAEQUDRAFT_739089 [Daedalea quercina L-15889]
MDYVYFAATTLYVYDYLLMLDREIKYFWKALPSFGTILFYFYRYPALANTILEVLSRMGASWQTAKMALDGILLISTAIFAALRVYAIFHRKRWVFVVVVVTSLINPGVLIYLFTRSIPSIGTVEGFSSCTLALAGGIPNYETVAGLISDSLVLILTFVKTSQARGIKKGGSDLEGSLKGVLLQDTGICFG